MKPIISAYMCPICKKEYNTKEMAENCIKAHRKECSHSECMYTLCTVISKGIQIEKPIGASALFQVEKECIKCGYKKTKHMWDKEIVELCFNRLA